MEINTSQVGISLLFTLPRDVIFFIPPHPVPIPIPSNAQPQGAMDSHVLHSTLPGTYSLACVFNPLPQKLARYDRQIFWVKPFSVLYLFFQEPASHFSLVVSTFDRDYISPVFAVLGAYSG